MHWCYECTVVMSINVDWLIDWLTTVVCSCGACRETNELVVRQGQTVCIQCRALADPRPDVFIYHGTAAEGSSHELGGPGRQGGPARTRAGVGVERYVDVASGGVVVAAYTFPPAAHSSSQGSTTHVGEKLPPASIPAGVYHCMANNSHATRRQRFIVTTEWQHTHWMHRVAQKKNSNSCYWDCCHWRRLSQNKGVGSGSIRSSHQTLSGTSNKLVLHSIFDTSLSSFTMWNLQSYPTTVLNERMWLFRGGGGGKTYSDPTTYFQGVRTPNPHELRPWLLLEIWTQVALQSSTETNYFKTITDVIMLIIKCKSILQCYSSLLLSARFLKLCSKNHIITWYTYKYYFNKDTKLDEISDISSLIILYRSYINIYYRTNTMTIIWN